MCRLVRLSAIIEAIEKQKSIDEDDWFKEWRAIGVAVRTPREMSRWVQDFHSVIQKAKEMGIRRQKAETLRQDIEALRTKMIRCMEAFSEPEDLKGLLLSGLIRRAQAIIDHEAKLLQHHEQLKRDKALKQKELAAATSR